MALLPPSLVLRLSHFEQWLLPGECLLCRGGLTEEAAVPLVCSLCRCRWTRLPEPICARCGQPRLLTDLDCRLCEAWSSGLGRVRSAVWHESGARDLVHQLKYEGWWRATEAMAQAMLHLEPLTGRLLLVPVPLAAKRRRMRGYNQSEHLAQAVGRAIGARVAAGALVRTRETPTQTALTPEERMANVAGAFAAKEVRGRRVVLVDDVFTTGATLVAAAAALGKGGATEVEAVTFARAKPAISDKR